MKTLSVVLWKHTLVCKLLECVYISSFDLFAKEWLPVERRIALPGMALARYNIPRYVLRERFSFSPPWVCSLQRVYASAGAPP